MSVTKNSSIYIAGHGGMVGSAILRSLKDEGFTNLITRTSRELDLKDQSSTELLFKSSKIDVVIDAAARVGGILANSEFPYEFLMENMLIQNNLINSSLKYGVKKFVFLGSSCIYPKYAPQPINENSLLTSSLEETNQWYAIAKISAVKAVQSIREEYGLDYVSLMPSNLYGRNDNFDLNTSHVLPAMIRKFHEATKMDKKEVTLWGTGNPMREFLFVDDLASAVLFILDNPGDSYLYNVGTGTDLTIKELAEKIKSLVGFNGEVVWDTSKPDGTPRKLLDISKFKRAGWKATTSLDEGLRKTYEWFLENEMNLKEVKISNRI